jgi:hypothetical protein
VGDVGLPWRAGDPLGHAEELMLECAAAGMMLDGAEDPLPRTDSEGEASPWIVRAPVLRHLLTGSEWPVDPKGVRLRRVRISGQLDLEGVTVRCPLLLRGCYLDDPEPLALGYATIPVLALHSCRLVGLLASNVVCSAKFDIQNSVFDGAITLNGARIGGALECRGARLGAGPDGISLVGRGMNVRLSVHLSQGFTTEGSVELPRAIIGGEFICPDAHVGMNGQGVSLEATGLRTGGAVYLDTRFRAQGAIRLNGASIGGQLSCDGARVGADHDGNSLTCDGLRTGGSVSMDVVDGQAFTARGAIRMAGAEITGSLSCRGAQLGADGDGNSLVADELKVSVGVLLGRGFAASGAVRLAGANIAGQLRCRAGRITGADHDGDSLIGNGIKVGGPAYLDEGFSATGAVALSGADIGGLLTFADARIGANGNRYSLVGDGLRAGRDVLGDGVVADGELLLAGAVIGGSLAFRGGKLGAGVKRNALMASGVRAGGDMLLDGLVTAGAVIAAGADIGGRLSCQGTRLGCDADGDALIADSARVGGSVFLDEQCTTAGAARFSLAGIGGSLRCTGARLGANRDHQALVGDQVNITGSLLLNKDFTAAGGVSLRGASIAGELCWQPAEPPHGAVDLTGARAQQLTDDWAHPRALGHWPSGRLRLSGFTYQVFGGDHQATVTQRLDWIRSQYTPDSVGTDPDNQTAGIASQPGQ